MYHIITAADEERMDRELVEQVRLAREQPEHPVLCQARREAEGRQRRIQAYRHEHGLTDPWTGEVPPMPDMPGDEARAIYLLESRGYVVRKPTP